MDNTAIGKDVGAEVISERVGRRDGSIERTKQIQDCSDIFCMEKYMSHGKKVGVYIEC